MIHPVRQKPLLRATVEPSIGSKGASNDNALTQTINGLQRPKGGVYRQIDAILGNGGSVDQARQVAIPPQEGLCATSVGGRLHTTYGGAYL